MAQSDDEIKMNSGDCLSNEKPVRPAPRSISRNSVARDLSQEPQISVETTPDEATTASRRQFFRGIIPAGGKLLAIFARTASATVGAAVERKK